MDAATVVPAGGLVVCFATMVGYWFRQYGTDRARDQAAITREQERTSAAEARTADALAREQAAQAQVDLERKLRRDAETAAAVAEAQLSVQRSKATWYAEEVDRLRFYLPPEIRPGVLPDAPVRGGNRDDTDATS